MADRFMQHHAGPAGPEHDVHLAGGGGNRFQIDEGLAQRAVGGVTPVLALDEFGVAGAAAITLAAALLAVALAGDDGDVDAHQRADVTIAFAVGPQDLDHLPGRAQTDADLPYPRILVAQIGVDLGKQFYLGLEAGGIERIVVTIKPHVGMRWRRCEAPGITAAHGRDRVRSANQRRQRNVGGVRIANRVVLDGAQPKALRSVVGRLLQPPVVEHQRFGLAIFQEQFAVVGTGKPARELVANLVAVEIGAVEQGGCGRVGHASVHYRGM
ncbi:hypothetical protein ACVWWG_002389 [Bradyrhizobium sp. LB7.2]